MYAGASEYLHTDAETNFTSEEFKSRTRELLTIVWVARTEAHNRIGKVKLCHLYMRTLYIKLCLYSACISREERLSLTFRALDDTHPTDIGIFPTTLVYGIWSKIPGAGDQGLLIKMVALIRESVAIVGCMKARKMRKATERIRNIPSHTEIEKVKTLPPSHHRNVHQEDGEWRMYELFRVKENDVDVVMPRGKISTFPIIAARFSHEMRHSN